MKKLILTSLFVSGVAWADEPPMHANDLVSPTSIVQGAGVKVGEGTVIHPTFGVETGVVSNVFYEETEANTAGLLRLLFEVSMGSLSGERTGIHNADATDPAAQAREAGAFAYSNAAYLSWDQYLSGNDSVQKQGGLGVGLLLKGIVNPEKTLSLSYLENFTRVIRATNFESPVDTNRDINQLTLRLAFQPQGRNIGGYVYYKNVIDYFEENDQQFANRFQNTFGARLNYQWLPLTRVYADASLGVFSGLGSDSTKIDAFPLQVVAGIMTALTLNLTVNGRIGYTQGFYASGPDYATITGGVQVGYRYSPFGRATLLYSYDHEDSINANFYRDHQVRLNIDQQFVPFAVNVGAEFHLRQYSGLAEVTGVMGVDGSDVRNDVIFGVTAGARYMFRNWAAAALDYRFGAVETDFRYDSGGGAIDDPSYLRHTLMLGFRAAY